MPVHEGNRSLASALRESKAAAVGAIATAVLIVVLISILLSRSSSDEHDPRIVVVKPSEVLELPSEADPQLVLRDTAEPLSPDDFVTTEPDWESDAPRAPEGFLLKVKRSTIVDGVTTAEVEPASLFEAEPEEQLATEGLSFRPVELSSVEESAPSLVAVDARGTVLARSSFTAASEAPTPAGEVEESLQRTFGCGSDGRIETEGKVDTSLDPNVKLTWSRRGRFSVGVDYAAAWVKGEATASFTARAVGDLRCEPKPVVLVEPSWRTVVVVGQVPVPVTVSLPVELSASARVHGEVFATAAIRSDAILGVRRHGSSDTERMAGFSKPELESPFNPRLEGTGSAEASVVPAVSIEAGWGARGLGKLAAVAKLGVRSGIHVGYAAGEDPPSRACLPVKVEASLTVHLPPRTRLGPWTVTPFERNLECEPPLPPESGAG